MSSSSESRPVNTPEESDSFFDEGTTEQEQKTVRYGLGVHVVGEQRDILDQGEPELYVVHLFR